MLDKLTIGDFQEAVHSLFKLDAGEGQVFELELVRVTKMTERDLGKEARSPFSAEFRGPESPILEQRIYRLEGPPLGELELFLVPIGPDSKGMLYEAIFT